jgi:hypothetical protein
MRVVYFAKTGLNYVCQYEHNVYERSWVNRNLDEICNQHCDVTAGRRLTWGTVQFFSLTILNTKSV